MKEVTLTAQQGNHLGRREWRPFGGLKETLFPCMVSSIVSFIVACFLVFSEK
jgi:hypothetical protein